MENIAAFASPPTKKAPHQSMIDVGLEYKDGGDLLSHTVSRAVPSALKSLTSVFGMGTGGASSLWPPKYLDCASKHTLFRRTRGSFFNELLVIKFHDNMNSRVNFV